MKLRSRAAVICIVVIAAAALAVAVTRAEASGKSSSQTNGELAYDPCPLEQPCTPGKVVVANPDGSAKRTLRMPWQSNHPVWSPDGTRLLVTAVRPPHPDRPAIMNADGSGLRLLDPGHPDLNLDCDAWSPDGSRLLCAGMSDQATLNGIYTIRASDGGDLTRLTTSPSGSYDAAPEYSPDGARFAFVRAPGDNGALFVANADGSGVHRITADLSLMAGGYGGLSWSPVLPGYGTEIVFTDAHWSLDTIRPDGTGLHVRFHGQDGCPCFFSPTWSPDGTRIAYALNPNATASDVYTANADGTHRVDITNSGAGEGWPSWGRHPLAPKCTAAERARRARAVSTYKRRMAAARRAYFRTHHGSKARAEFVKAQHAKLRTLEQRAKACVANRSLSAFGQGSPGWNKLDSWMQNGILDRPAYDAAG